MAPGANILLVETPVAETEGTTGFPEIVAAENFVINHHLGDVITQSFGATEETFPNAGSIFALRGAYFNALAHRVTVLGLLGRRGPDRRDRGPGRGGLLPLPRQQHGRPADPLVTSVGGTHLQSGRQRHSPGARQRLERWHRAV